MAAPGLEELEALQTILRSLQELDPAARRRILASVHAFFGLTHTVRPPEASSGAPAPEPGPSSFSADRTPSPKDFLFGKKPQTDVDRIACLAYYLTHYRETPHFKTIDLSRLNTEAAQLKLSNAAHAVDNAAKASLLVPASKGAKQLSALGELYVEALPDRAAAREAIADAKPKRKGRKGAPGARSGSDSLNEND
jgi:hypothetical protein